MTDSRGPTPFVTRIGSNPRPRSSTVTITVSPAETARTTARVVPECLHTLVRNSVTARDRLDRVLREMPGAEPGCVQLDPHPGAGLPFHHPVECDGQSAPAAVQLTADQVPEPGRLGGDVIAGHRIDDHVIPGDDLERLQDVIMQRTGQASAVALALKFAQRRRHPDRVQFHGMP